jgi:hypothetical protein
LTSSSDRAFISRLFALNVITLFVVYSINPDLQGSLALLKVDPGKKDLVVALWVFAIGFTIAMAYMMAQQGKVAGLD